MIAVLRRVNTSGTKFFDILNACERRGDETHFAAARALILRAIRLDLLAPWSSPEKMQRARNLSIRMLGLKILRQHSFRALRSAAPLKPVWQTS